MNAQDIQINITKLSNKNLALLEADWLMLEQHASPQFFLSWRWISSWLDLAPENACLYLVKATKNTTVVGLGIFNEVTEKRNYIVYSKQWHLHRYHCQHLDQIWIENNGFLMNKEIAKELEPLIWSNIFYQFPNIDEFIINVEKKNSNKISFNSYHTTITDSCCGYRAKVEPLNTVLSEISKNTRSQIKRSIKELQRRGTLKFEVYTEATKQINLLEKNQHWHIAKWKNTNTPSGFENPFFKKFHQQLMTNADNENTQTLVSTLTVDNEDIVTLYCLMQTDTVYFYLSCIKPLENKKIKAGLVAHLYMIDWLSTTLPTIKYYDFLAGDAQYKRSLSSIKDLYHKRTIQKKKWMFAIERGAKALIHSLAPRNNQLR